MLKMLHAWNSLNIGERLFLVHTVLIEVVNTNHVLLQIGHQKGCFLTISSQHLKFG